MQVCCVPNANLVLSDLGDCASRASVKASAASYASIAIGNLSRLVAKLEYASRAGVNANAASNALVGINNGVRHNCSIPCKPYPFAALNPLQAFMRTIPCVENIMHSVVCKV